MASEQEVIRVQTVLRSDGFDLTGHTETMMAVVTTGNGGLDKLDYRDVPVPRPGPGELLLRILAAGVNATEINTRLRWYSSSVTASTQNAAEAEERAAVAKDDGGWSAATPFPLIQGTDCCGRVVEVVPGDDESMIGRRVLVRPCMRPLGFGSMETIWMASDFDGAFAQFVKVPAAEVFAVECALGDAELGAIPCAYGTAENMLHRAGVTGAEHVVVTGASGGVGSAVVQLAKRRGAAVTAVAGRAQTEQVRAIGADRVIDRDDDIVVALGERSVDVIVDNVAGPAFGGLLDVLKRGGRYVSSGRHRRPDRDARQTHLLPQGPDHDRLHGVERARVPDPHLRHCRRRGAAARRQDVSAREDRRRAGRVPREEACRQLRPEPTLSGGLRREASPRRTGRDGLAGAASRWPAWPSRSSTWCRVAHVSAARPFTQFRADERSPYRIFLRNRIGRVLINRSISIAILRQRLYGSLNVMRGGVAARGAAAAHVVSQAYAKGE